MFATACSNPTAPAASDGSPASDRLPLTPGSCVLVAYITSLDFPARSDCQGTGVSQGVSHLSYVALTQEGPTWVVRSEAAEYGDAELRFGATVVLSTGNVTVSGSARGTSHDLRSAASLGVATMTFTDDTVNHPAVLSGVTSTFPWAQVSGSIRGSVAATFGSLGSGACAQAFWGVEAGKLRDYPHLRLTWS